MVGALEATAQRLASETERLSAGATAIASAIEGVAARLASMQTPDHVIEIKLTPMVQALSEAVDRFGASAQAQSRDAAAAIAGATAAAEASARVAADVGRWAERHDTASRDAVELALQTAAATRDAVAGLAVASRENARRIQDALAEMNGSIQVLNGIASKSEADAEGRAIASKALFIALERSARALEVAAERTTSPASIIDVANVRTAAEVAS
jgi:hypothetical protein